MKHLKTYEGYYHKELFPFLWEGGTLNQRIRQKLLTIAEDFYNDLGYDIPIKDIILTGSIANYNWHAKSDIDIHILLDFSQINEDIELVKDYLDGKRFIWNLKHDITIKGHDIEMYLQDINEEHVASGQYSILNNEWIVKPKYEEHQIDEEEVDFKYKTYKSGIEKFVEIASSDLTPEEAADYYQYSKKYWKKIHGDRKIGLEEGGEYSVKNLVYKKLRADGDLEKLLDIINKFYDLIYVQ